MAGEQLRVTEGKEGGKLLAVDAELLIGRQAPENEGRLGGDPEISRRHARVSRGADQRLTIEDLGSANGTFVNDKRIDAPQRLEPGDLVKIGRTVLQVTGGSGRVADSLPQPPPAAAGKIHAVGAQAGQVLLVTDGVARGRRLVLEDELLIGRGVTGDGKLGDDLGLSRRHARIARGASGELTVEDLGSANGTYVNGKRVHGQRVLKVGDSLRVGLTTMQLTDRGGVSLTEGDAARPARAVAPHPPSPGCVGCPCCHGGQLGAPRGLKAGSAGRRAADRVGVRSLPCRRGHQQRRHGGRLPSRGTRPPA